MKKLLLFVIISFECFGLTNKFEFKDYEESSKASSFIKFESESTKLGIITTSFDGYAKNFQVSADQDSAFLRNVKVEFKSKSLDTDNSSRDEKMYEQTLSVDKYEKVMITIDSAVRVFDKEGAFQRVPAKINIRGKSFPITLRAKVFKVGESIRVSGDTQISLKALEIPDPSIAIASVRDRFDLSFQVELK